MSDNSDSGDDMEESIAEWLKKNDLDDLEPDFKQQGVRSIDDLKLLQNEQDVDDFINGLKIGIIKRKRLKPCIMTVVVTEAIKQRINNNAPNEQKSQQNDSNNQNDLNNQKNQPKKRVVGHNHQPIPVEDTEKIRKQDELGSWLNNIGLGQHFNTLIAGGYEDLSYFGDGITDEELREAGIKQKPHRRRLLAEIQKLYEADSGNKMEMKNDYFEQEEKKESIKPKRNLSAGYHRVPLIQNIDPSRKHRTIMMIGATGTGKTTLLNSMMNYLFEVDLNDKYRFKLVFEQSKQGGQAESQTDNVSAYHLDPDVLDYQLTVIDTPGYGDTRGIKRDQQITKNIKTFFEQKVQDIDAVCFVIRAPQARLTATQKYIFDSVLSIFGNDIKNNIFILLTFADGKKPQALVALKEGKVPYNKHFKLNNSAFGLEDKDDNDDECDQAFTQTFWDMGIKAFVKFFDALRTVQPKSLTLTKKVLTRREELETYIDGVQPMIRKGFTLLDSMRKQIVQIDKYADLVNANKDFMVEHTVTKAKQVPNGGACTTTCRQCNYTCHEHCAFTDDKDKERCSSMDKSTGNCTVCPDNCHWTFHSNKPYKIEYHTETEKKPVADLKDKYVDAKNKQSASEQIINGLKNDLKSVQNDLTGLINDVRKCINELNQIALRPNVLTQNDYLDKLIQSEEAERKPGYKDRIVSLNALKEKQQLIKEVNSDQFEPFKKYNDVLKRTGKPNKKEKKKGSNKAKKSKPKEKSKRKHSFKWW